MNQHKSKFFILFLIILVILLPACSVPGTRSGSRSRADSSFTRETTIDEIDLEIKPAMRSHTLELDLEVEAGRLMLELSDPNGELQWSEVFEAPAKFDETFNLDLIVGDWILKINLEDASGNYSIRWEGSD